MQGISQSNYRVISAKTADYQIMPEDIGKLFTNRGAAGAVIFTLPVVANIATGWWCRFFTAVLAQNVTIASADSADNITTFNDLTADSVALSTASERAGFGAEYVWDGTGWLAFHNLGAETQTPTIA